MAEKVVKTHNSNVQEWWMGQSVRRKRGFCLCISLSCSWDTPWGDSIIASWGKVTGVETPIWELDDKMMHESLEMDEVPEELRTVGRKCIWEKDPKQTVMYSGEKICLRRVLRRQWHQTCGRRKPISEDRRRVTKKVGWTIEKGKVRRSKRKEFKTLKSPGTTVVFMECGSTLRAKTPFCDFKSALLNNWKITESEVVSSWK